MYVDNVVINEIKNVITNTFIIRKFLFTHDNIKIYLKLIMMELK